MKRYSDGQHHSNQPNKKPYLGNNSTANDSYLSGRRQAYSPPIHNSYSKPYNSYSNTHNPYSKPHNSFSSPHNHSRNSGSGSSSASSSPYQSNKQQQSVVNNSEYASKPYNTYANSHTASYSNRQNSYSKPRSSYSSPSNHLRNNGPGSSSSSYQNNKQQQSVINNSVYAMVNQNKSSTVTAAPPLPQGMPPKVPPPTVSQNMHNFLPSDHLNRKVYVHIPPPAVSPVQSTSQQSLTHIPSPGPHTNYFLQRPPPTYQPRVPWRGVPISPIGPVGISPTLYRWPLQTTQTGQTPYVRPARKKPAKKTIPQNVPTRVIKIEDAEAALKCEIEHSISTKQLVIRFPDPPIDRDTVLSFHPAIKKVHFQHPSVPRFCFIQLDLDADTDTVIKELCSVKFGQGNLKVELKHELLERRDRPEDIDPYVLFVGNIGQHTPAEHIKNLFYPGRVDIGPSMRMKNSRYALVKFATVEDAITVFNKTRSMVVDNYSLNVRFRRLNGSVGLPGERAKKNQSQTNTRETVETNKTTENNTPPEENHVTDSTTVVKKEEEVDTYDYFEYPEPDDEIDIKMKNEYYNENGEYMEQPEENYEDFDNGYFYENCDTYNNYNGENNDSLNYTPERSTEGQGLSQNEFSEHIRDLFPTSENFDDTSRVGSGISSGTQSSSNTPSSSNTTDLGHSVKQIHLPMSSPKLNADVVQVKSELENDDYEPSINQETDSFLSEFQNIGGSSLTTGSPRPQPSSNDVVSKTQLSDQNSVLTDNNSTTNSNNEFLVRIPRDKIQINTLSHPTSKEAKPADERNKSDEECDDETFAREIKALLNDD